MSANLRNGSESSSSSLNSSFHDTEDDQTIARILAEEQTLDTGSSRQLGRRLSHLDSIPVCINHMLWLILNSFLFRILLYYVACIVNLR